MAASDQEIAQVRSMANQLKEKIKQDPSLGQKLKADPQGTLTANGFPADAAASISKQLNQDVSGLDLGEICTDTYCISYGDTLYCTGVTSY